MNDDWESKTIIGSKKRTAKVARKEGDINAARRTGTVVSTDKKIAAGRNKAHQGTDHQRIAKLDRENEVAPPAKVRRVVSETITAARVELGKSIKDLAEQIYVKPSLIQQYESAEAIPDPRILGKLERALGVKLRGANIGKKLPVRVKKDTLPC